VRPRWDGVWHRDEKKLYKLIGDTARTARSNEISSEVASTFVGATPNTVSIDRGGSLLAAGYLRQDGSEVRRRLSEVYSRISPGSSNAVTPFDAKYFVISGSHKLKCLNRDLGIPLPFMIELIEQNIVEQADTDIEKFLSRPPTGLKSGLKERLLSTAQRGLPPAKSVRLQAFSALVSEPKNPWSIALDAMLAGRLPYWASHGSSTLMSQIWIEDLDFLADALKAAPPQPYLFNLPVYTHDQALFLGGTPQAIWNLRKAGLLSDNTLSAVKALTSESIPICEVRVRLPYGAVGRSGGLIAKELDEAGVFRCSNILKAVLYPRAQVEEYYASRLVQPISERQV